MSDDKYYPVERNFKYHAPQKDQIPRYQNIRDYGLNMARYIMESCPRSSERNQALQRLEEAVMWANASIARNEKDDSEVIHLYLKDYTINMFTLPNGITHKRMSDSFLEVKELRNYIGYIVIVYKFDGDYDIDLENHSPDEYIKDEKVRLIDVFVDEEESKRTGEERWGIQFSRTMIDGEPDEQSQ